VERVRAVLGRDEVGGIVSRFVFDRAEGERQRASEPAIQHLDLQRALEAFHRLGVVVVVGDGQIDRVHFTR
jgi:hypothetical protein